MIWMWNDCWGENGWTPIDYCLRRKPSWYWLRRACLPIRAIARRRGDELVVRVVNDTLASQDVTVHAGWLRADGTASEVAAHLLTVPANGMVEVLRSPVPPPEQRPHNEWIFATWAAGEGVEAAPCVWTFVPHRQLKTGDPRLRVKVEGARITLAAAYAHGVGHDDRGERLFSDNWFDLVPGLPHTIDCLATVPDQLHFAPFDAAGLVSPATGNH